MAHNQYSIAFNLLKIANKFGDFRTPTRWGARFQKERERERRRVEKNIPAREREKERETTIVRREGDGRTDEGERRRKEEGGFQFTSGVGWRKEGEEGRKEVAPGLRSPPLSLLHCGVV